MTHSLNGNGGPQLRVLAETAYPLSAPGSRVRLASFVPFLESQGVDLDYRPQLTNEEYGLLTSPAPVREKATAVLNSSRRLLAARHQEHDLRLVYRVRALFPLPGLEPPRGVDVYDFDDALFLGSISDANVRYAWLKRESERWLKYMRAARLVIAGNAFLADRARQFARRVEIVPSCIDPGRYQLAQHREKEVINVGWIGSRSTSDYLTPILPVFERINRNGIRMKLVLVGAAREIDAPWIEHRPWSVETEASDLADFDIGIMPLPHDDWARGKCGYKVLQYFAAGVPAVSSPVGVNKEFIGGDRGCLVETGEEWADALETLAADVEARRELGRAGHEFAAAHYSYQRWAPDFAEILRAAATTPVAAPRVRPSDRQPSSRILHLLPCDDWGGTEVQISTQVLLTDPSESHQTVVILERPGVVYERLRSGGVEVHSVTSRAGLVGALRRLVRILRADDYDAIEAYGFKAGLLARIASRMAGNVRVIIGVRGLHFTAAGETGVGRNTRVVLRVERLLSSMVYRFDANSEGARNYLVSEGFDADQFKVIVNGVETEGVPVADHNREGPPKIVCVARFVPLKRHELLLRALAQIRREGIDFDCELIGYGPTLEGCRELAEELGIAECVSFHGRLPQEEIRRRLADADLFALVSMWEGMPGSVLEAMAAGLPVVGTNVNGTNEVVVDGETGLLVPAGDLESLRVALTTLLEDRDLRARMGQAGRRRAERHFSFERVVEEKMRFYAELAGVSDEPAVERRVPLDAGVD